MKMASKEKAEKLAGILIDFRSVKHSNITTNENHPMKIYDIGKTIFPGYKLKESRLLNK